MFSLLGTGFQNHGNSIKSAPASKVQKDKKPKEMNFFRPWLTEADPRADFKADSKADPEADFKSDFKSDPGNKNDEKDEEEEICLQNFDAKNPLAAEPKDPVAKPNESQMNFELLATNLGKSRDGYQCIYCGKMYSRKYGLKIHLRTHTGFRPLKCQVIFFKKFFNNSFFVKICNRAFGDPSDLFFSIILFSFKICNRAFGDPSNLFL